MQVRYDIIPFESSDWTRSECALWMYPIVCRATFLDASGAPVDMCEYAARSRRVARARCREYARVYCAPVAT